MLESVIIPGCVVVLDIDEIEDMLGSPDDSAY